MESPIVSSTPGTPRPEGSTTVPVRTTFSGWAVAVPAVNRIAATTRMDRASRGSTVHRPTPMTRLTSHDERLRGAHNTLSGDCHGSRGARRCGKMSQVPKSRSRLVPSYHARPPPRHSAALGQITDFTSEIRLAGNPPRRACSRLNSGLGAMQALCSGWRPSERAAVRADGPRLMRASYRQESSLVLIASGRRPPPPSTNGPGPRVSSRPATNLPRKCGEPHYRELEPAGRLAATGRGAPTSGVSRDRRRLRRFHADPRRAP